jgi:hypothetical protein
MRLGGGNRFTFECDEPDFVADLISRIKSHPLRARPHS